MLTLNIATRFRPNLSNNRYASAFSRCAGLVTFLLYIFLSVSFFGRTSLSARTLSEHTLGTGPDPGAMIWFLVWWPHALSTGLNPFLTKVMWAPQGINLAWLTTMPLVAILASPFTHVLGPISTYNLLSLLSLPIDAWCTFLLCRHLTGNYWASFAGGYLFGFSAFMLSHLAYGHLVVVLAFGVPLVAYLAILTFSTAISAVQFVSLFTLILVAQFLVSLETFATSTLFGGVILLLGWSAASGQQRRTIQRLGMLIVASYALCFVIVSPYLYYFFHFNFMAEPLFLPTSFSTDLFNLVIPTEVNELGRCPILLTISRRFLGGWASECSGYIGLPLLAIAFLQARSCWHDLSGRLLAEGMIVPLIMSFGPILHANGADLGITMPWAPLAHLPLLSNALPARFALYVMFVVSILASFWLADPARTWRRKMVFVLLIALFNTPNLRASFWSSPISIPSFFADGLYKRQLQRGENVMTLPYGYQGNAMLWQASTKMYFSLTEGYGGARPEEFKEWPIVDALLRRYYIPDAREEMRVFLTAHQVRSVIVEESALLSWKDLLASSCSAPIKIGGIWVFPVLASDTAMTATGMRKRFDVERFSRLVQSVQGYLAAGGSLESLSVLELAKSGVIPATDLIGPAPAINLGGPESPNVITDAHRAFGVFLSPMDDGRVEVGVYAWGVGAAAIVDKLRDISPKIYFPHPDGIQNRNFETLRAEHGWFVVVFTRQQLSEAAKSLSLLYTS